ncbi:chromosome segregation protein SMC [Halobacillus salinarum]|uniref:Chromosome partition protein Smc n=1 Tax=Halobacillus salinarum TaxID=2932257 RepID=A0ABY4EG09_9BACI|nr:chromosome segregation protein SMC [Halobacillus salinarum]UOQ43081.1 chromosome segregation protein SMC [Halobacillus salinarum]
MFLKRLDTKGFKSFAERVTVDFVNGVTSVVGPNGSGKSNITDAIRWVLGEQSAKSLRGSKMEDIIFAGSDSRKPLNMAEVTLTLNNKDQTLPLDYEEVSVTRRVYRSGESEFYINNQTCRLKDIVDLFMDSGLGKEAFSIISQGKVEEILSSKAEERRSIFEEAAGVLKYKQRKRKAEQKLGETQENLNRVEDIVYEIEGQLEPLKLQASVAKDYLEKKEELKKIEVSLLITQIESLHSDWQKLLDELKEIKQQEEELNNSIESGQEKIERQRDQMQALDESIEDLQETLLVLTKDLENLEGKKELMKERHKHYSENKTKIEGEYKELSIKLEELKVTLQKENSELTEARNQGRQLKKELKETNETLSQGAQNIEDQIEELKSEYIDLLNDQAAKKNEKQLLSQQQEQLSTKQDRQQDKFKDLRLEREKTEKKLTSVQTACTEKEQERTGLQRRHAELSQSYEKNEAAYQEWQQKLYQGYQYMEKLRSKKEMLEDMKEDFSGYFQGVREVLKAREAGKLSGIEGAVIEVMEVPSHLITAIETALGAQAQHVIVTDERSGRAAIHWLKQTNKGRATFLPLSSIHPRSLHGQAAGSLENLEGVVGVAGDLVSYQEKHKKAIQHLLGHIVIAETLEQANAIARQLNRKYRVVTLEGDVVNPGGSMSGGAQKKSGQSLFTRDKELQELTQKISTYEQKTAEVEKKVQHLKTSVQKEKQEAERLKVQLEEAQNEEYEIQSQKRELELKVQHLNDQLQLFDQDQLQFREDHQYTNEKLDSLEAALSELNHQLETIQQEIESLTERKQKQKLDEDHLQGRVQELKVLIAEQDSFINNQQEKVERYRVSYQETEAQLVQNKDSYQQLVEIVESNQTEEEIGEQIEQTKQRKQATSQLIQERRKERNEYGVNVQEAERLLKETKRRHGNFVQEIQQKEVKEGRMDVELENLLTYLQEEYVMTFEKAKQNFPRVEDIRQAETDVKLIKRSIDELGTVNLGAIEEYDRILERYEFLTGQQEDLLEAKRTLHSIINEMDGEMQRRFEDTFTKIKAEFGSVFQSLFGGGKADLVLTSPEDLLETGVDIVAQPPGKKLQNLSLLSGGERALTAIALLFSILRVRPVPFCVLDEVEAALDEANVDRFAKFLKEFSSKTQFIVITHRKGTMEESDVLYGVTMQESGVSKLVSVKLEETTELLEV